MIVIMNAVKVFSFLVILLAVIVGAGIYSFKALSSTSQKLESHVANIEDCALNGSWNKAKENLSYFKDDWAKTEKIWTILLDHAEMDNIDASLSKVTMFIETRDKPLTLGEIANLKQFVKHIPQKESFNLKNIL
jgi:hypothetical protein